MGGRLALHLAAHYPERFQSVVLEGASPGLPSPSDRLERRRVDAGRAAELARDLPAFLERWYRMPLFATLSTPERARLVAERCAQDPRELARALVGMGTGAQAPLWNWLGRLAVPVHAVAGGLDAKFVDLARQMQARSGGRIRAHVLPGAGHMAHAERPDAFALLVHRLVTAADAPGS
jgi:2-succinyl-6-hydroxy-2,4-cyclohexadiene-1-carboxylate synthase